MGLLGRDGFLSRGRATNHRLFREETLVPELSDGALHCFLCERPIGRRVQWHHAVPKSRGGRDTVPVHPICHRAIHATLSNKELERGYSTAEALRSHPEIAKFVGWVSSKDPDFNAPTRRRKN